uniref:Mab-21 domain-containing protein n=1 Tax=Macrostomum lignano TaxID=282301 RepID=A0A1I8JKB7_9PLAT
CSVTAGGRPLDHVDELGVGQQLHVLGSSDWHRGNRLRLLAGPVDADIQTADVHRSVAVAVDNIRLLVRKLTPVGPAELVRRLQAVAEHTVGAHARWQGLIGEVSQSLEVPVAMGIADVLVQVADVFLGQGVLALLGLNDGQGFLEHEAGRVEVVGAGPAALRVTEPQRPDEAQAKASTDEAEPPNGPAAATKSLTYLSFHAWLRLCKKCRMTLQPRLPPEVERSTDNVDAATPFDRLGLAEARDHDAHSVIVTITGVLKAAAPEAAAVSHTKPSAKQWIMFEWSRVAKRVKSNWAATNRATVRPQLYLDYRGRTTFGIQVSYSQTPLALAVQFHQWDTFKRLVQSAASHPEAQQRMLVASSCSARLSGTRRCSTRDFGNALELLVWSLTQAQYCPSHLTECELLELFRLTVRQSGANQIRLPQQLLQRLCHAAMLDLVYRNGAAVHRIEASTALHRCALAALKCLAQHGMLMRYRDCWQAAVLYHLLLCFLTDSASVRELRSSRRLRLLLCLLLNAIYGDGVSLPDSVFELADSATSCTRLFWRYYAVIKGRPDAPAIDWADFNALSSAHRRFKRFCNKQPIRLAILARNAVRKRLLDCLAALSNSTGNFAGSVARLPLKRRLRQAVEFMDEKYLDDEISGILVRIGCAN